MKKVTPMLKIVIVLLGIVLLSQAAFAQPKGTMGDSGDPEPTGTMGDSGDPQPTTGESFDKLQNPLGKGGIQTIPDLVKAILEIALKIGVPLIALAIIYSGFKFIAAQGNPEKLKEAKQTLIYVVIGAAILLAAYAIATAIVNTVGSVTG